jgi:branched-chain amino acid transport system substrate-binding protein
MNRSRIALVAASVAAVAMVVSACSSSGGSKASSSSAGSAAGGGSAASSAASPTGAPFKIGVECQCSGGLGTPDGGTVYKAWASAVNAAGGINGHPVQVTVADDASNPGTALTNVQGFIKDGDIAIADDSSLDEAWQKAAEAANIPVIGIGTSTSPFYSSADFFAEGQTEDRLFDAIVGAAQKIGGTKLGLIYCAEAIQCQEGIQPLKDKAKELGMDLPYAGSVSATAPNYTAQCLAAKQAGVDTLFIADAQSVDVKVVGDCAAQGYHPFIVEDGEVMSPLYQNAAQAKGATVIMETPNVPYNADIPAITQMNAAINKYAPDELKSSGYGEIPMESWVSGKLLEAAAKAGNVGANGAAPSAADLLTGLHALKDETLDGLAPPLNFAAGKPNPVDCWYLVVLKNGQYSTPYGTDSTCVKPGS